MTWLDDFSRALDGHPQRNEILVEVSELLASGVEFGDAVEFAEQLRGTSSHDWTRHIRGLLDDAEARLAWFDPSNPHFLIPRTIGFGWDINFGAIAVKLGLLRPDDVDAQVIAAIPDRVVNAIRIAPAALAVVGLALTAIAPDKIGPTKYSITGKPTGLKNLRANAIQASVGLGAIASFAGTRVTRQDQLVTSAIAGGIGLAVVLQLAQNNVGSGNPLWHLARVGAVASPLVTFSRAVTAGLKKVTR